MDIKKKRFKGKPNCSFCRHYQFSITLGSSGIPIWHCRFGYSPQKFMMDSFNPPRLYDCRSMAQFNVDFMNSSEQLSLSF